LVAKYSKVVVFMFKRRWLTFILLVVACGGLVYLMNTTKTGLVPKEDMGSINVDVRTPPGTNIAETDKVLAEIDRRISTIPQIKAYSRTTGWAGQFGQGSSTGNFVIRLHDWEDRKGKGDDVDSVMEEIYARTADINSADIMVYTRGMIPGYGASSGFEVYIQDQKGGKLEDLEKISKEFIAELNKRPEVSRAKTSFDSKFPMYLVEVDAAQCKRNGTSPGDVLNVLAGYVGVFCGLILAMPFVLPVSKKTRKIIGISILGCIAATLVILFTVDIGNGFLHELHELLHGRADDSFGSSRIYIWKRVLGRVRNALFLGYGPDTMLLENIGAFSRLHEELNIMIESQIDTAHSEYLNILFHQGMFAFVAYIMALVSAVKHWITSGSSNTTVAILGSAVLCYCIQACFGISSCITAIYFWLSLGLLESYLQRKTERSNEK
jgi:hypothetical protein